MHFKCFSLLFPLPLHQKLTRDSNISRKPLQWVKLLSTFYREITKVLEIKWEIINILTPVLSSSDFICTIIFYMSFICIRAHLTNLCLLNQFTKLISALHCLHKASQQMARVYSRLRDSRLLYYKPTPMGDECSPRMICVCYDTCL